MPTVTKFCRVVAYNEQLAPIKSHDYLMTWLVKVHDKLSKLYLHFHRANGYQTRQVGQLLLCAFTRKVTQQFKHVELSEKVSN